MPKDTLRPVRTKLLLFTLLILVIVPLAIAVKCSYQDLDRERETLKDLYQEKGEMLIRMTDISHSLGWLKVLDDQTLAESQERLAEQGVIWMAVTTADGALTAASLPLDSFDETVFSDPPPAPLKEFDRNWLSRGREMRQADGQLVFVAYRALLSSVEIRQPGHRRPGERHDGDAEAHAGAGAAPLQPDDPGLVQDDAYYEDEPASPDQADGGDDPAGTGPAAGPDSAEPAQAAKRPGPKWPEADMENSRNQARYLWVAFDYGKFEQADDARGRNILLFLGMGLLAIGAMVGVIILSSKLMRSKELTEEIIARLPIGLLVTDPEDRVTRVNQAATKIIGLAPALIEGQTMADLTGGTFPSEMEFANREMAIEGQTMAGPAGGASQSGTEPANRGKAIAFTDSASPTVSITCAPLAGLEGGAYKRVILLTDISEITRLNEKLAATAEELATTARLSRLGGLATGLARNIRNPVGSIKAVAQLLLGRKFHSDPDPDRPNQFDADIRSLLESLKSAGQPDLILSDPYIRSLLKFLKSVGELNPNPSDPYIQSLQIILKCVNQLNRTINDFSDFALQQSKPEMVDLAKVVREVHQDWKLKQPDLGMELELPPGQLTVNADAARLKVALDSIYRNAAEAVGPTPDPPGRIKVTVGTVSTASRPLDTKVQVRIADNGPGFTSDQLKTPFVPYATTKRDNTGLGLAKASAIIDNAKGSVVLANDPAGGAVVTINLPLVDAPSGPTGAGELQS